MEKTFKIRITNIPEDYDTEELVEKLEFVINQFLYGNPCIKEAFIEEITS